MEESLADLAIKLHCSLQNKEKQKFNRNQSVIVKSSVMKIKIARPISTPFNCKSCKLELNLM